MKNSEKSTPWLLIRETWKLWYNSTTINDDAILALAFKYPSRSETSSIDTKLVKAIEKWEL